MHKTMKNYKENPVTKPLDAIKEKCYFDCCAEDYDSYANCNIETCALWHFRFGKNPFRKKSEMTEEHRNELMKRLEKANLAKKSC